jgi:hypothetical protein
MLDTLTVAPAEWPESGIAEIKEIPAYDWYIITLDPLSVDALEKWPLLPELEPVALAELPY